jgi:glycine oxidase
VALDAIFVGGGAIGLAGAWESARRGLRVAVVDPCPGRGATWVAAGMLAPVSETHYGEEPLLRLLLAGADCWAGFAAALEEATGTFIDYRRSGTVVVALDASDRVAVDDVLSFQQSLGLDARRLSSSECRQQVPALSPAVRGGAESPSDHQVDNRRMVDALVAACGAAGVEMVADSVQAVTWETGGRAQGVTLRDGTELVAGAVVVAAGADSNLVGGIPEGLIPPVRPVKGHVVRLRAGGSPVLARTVRGLVHGRSVYLVPRADGSLVIGATVEEKGFDRRVQAGAVHALLDDARAIVPGIDELELVECLAGLRPGSVDNAPFIGWTTFPGLAAASGHYRNGILLTPISGLALAALLCGEAVPDAVAPFHLARATSSPVPPAGHLR